MLAYASLLSDEKDDPPPRGHKAHPQGRRLSKSTSEWGNQRVRLGTDWHQGSQCGTPPPQRRPVSSLLHTHTFGAPALVTLAHYRSTNGPITVVVVGIVSPPSCHNQSQSVPTGSSKAPEFARCTCVVVAPRGIVRVSLESRKGSICCSLWGKSTILFA